MTRRLRIDLSIMPDADYVNVAGRQLRVLKWTDSFELDNAEEIEAAVRWSDVCSSVSDFVRNAIVVHLSNVQAAMDEEQVGESRQVAPRVVHTVM